MEQKLEKRIEAIEKRNQKVEADKAWETSWTRRLIIAFITYITVCLYLFYIDSAKPLLGALVPVIGYLLSTVIIKKIKNKWVNNRAF